MRNILREIITFFYVRYWGILVALCSDPEYVMESKDREHWRPLIVNIARFKIWFKKTLDSMRQL